MASDKRLDQVNLVNSAESVLVVNGDKVEKATLAGFANSMGSSVPLQQTSEQANITGLYARTSDGKMVELTNESVASVMAGLMTSSKLFPFMGNGTAQYGDLNNITDSGFYHVGAENNYQNTPGFGWFCLAVYKSYIITQVAFGLSSSGTWYRTREDSGSSSWSPWRRLDNFGYNTLADLSSAVAGYNKIKYKESSSAGNILEKRTMGFIFAYNTDNMEYYIGSYNNGTEQMPFHQKISGNLEISWFNQFGSFTIEGANKFIIIYIDK